MASKKKRQTFEKLKRELHRLEIVRREFVANISHELRAPIAAVKAIVETLQSGALEDRQLALDFLEPIFGLKVAGGQLGRLFE